MSTTAPTRHTLDIPVRQQRTWPAVLTLLLLPGLTAEALTGSTPILVYLTNPLSFITNTLLYGGGALLIRELARRRRLGWTSVLLFGAAYGVFEEGLVVNTWANPWLPQVCADVHGQATGLCDYGRVGGINLSWATSLTLFHAVISITIPILLVELLFPVQASLPWLGRKLAVALVFGELLILVIGVALNIVSFHQHHLASLLVGPYLVELVLMAIFTALGLALRTPGPREASAHQAPHIWTLRLFGFFGLLVNTLLASIFKSARIPFEVELLVNAALLLAGSWRMLSWSQRRGWNQQHQLALATGALGFFIVVWAPILELVGTAGGKPTRGTIVWALCYLIFLIVLASRLADR